MHDFKDARLDIIIGTMFSGKTTYLLSEISKLTQLNYKILYINIDFDARSDNFFSTHNPLFDKHFDFNNNSIKHINQIISDQDTTELSCNEPLQKSGVTMLKSKELVKIDVISYDIIKSNILENTH